MTILQSLDRYYDRMAARGEVVAPGWSPESIGFVIGLASDGSITEVTLLRDPTGKKPQPRSLPKWFTRSGNGSTPYFLWDNTAYALGVSTKDPGKTGRDHDAFRNLHISELANEMDPGLLAVRRFLEDHWTPDGFTQPLFNERMLAWNVAFRFDGSSQLIHERPAALPHIERLRAAAGSGSVVQCLVTGQRLPGVRLHGKIKGVDGTASAEVPLVSFNLDAFASYGKEQGDNAPTSEAAAFRYGAALNRLLERGASRNRIRIADATVAFWADTSAMADREAAERAAEAAEKFAAGMLGAEAADTEAPPDDDLGEAAKLRDALDHVAKGRPTPALALGLDPDTRFHVLGLAPNAARLSVRFWLDDRFDNFAARLLRHFDDLSIEPPPWGRKLPSISRLLVKTTALQEKFENIPPQIAGEVARAVLAGTPYPRTLLAAAVGRLRAGDGRRSGWHAAAIKAVINRSGQEQLPVALDPDNPNVAYQLGRLFATLESAQREALGQVNAPIGDRYYGAASSTPARVFAALLRGAKTHASDARKRNRGGWIEPKLNEIIAKLPADLPRSLRLEDQGRFAVGYYHERAFRPAKAEADTKGGGTADDE